MLRRGCDPGIARADMGDSSLENTAGPVVLVTRPEAQSAVLVEQLERQGLRALAMPMLALQALQDASGIATVKTRHSLLEDAEAGIFISTNAVSFGMAVIEDIGRKYRRDSVGMVLAQPLQPVLNVMVVAPARLPVR